MLAGVRNEIPRTTFASRNWFSGHIFLNHIKHTAYQPFQKLPIKYMSEIYLYYIKIHVKKNFFAPVFYISRPFLSLSVVFLPQALVNFCACTVMATGLLFFVHNTHAHLYHAIITEPVRHRLRKQKTEHAKWVYVLLYFPHDSSTPSVTFLSLTRRQCNQCGGAACSELSRIPNGNPSWLDLKDFGYTSFRTSTDEQRTSALSWTLLMHQNVSLPLS